jgi:hypothetical protein
LKKIIPTVFSLVGSHENYNLLFSAVVLRSRFSKLKILKIFLKILIYFEILIK